MRSKWQKESASIREGDIVLFRVEEVHPGKDGLMRTVTVRAQEGVFNRLVQRLHRLEIDAAAPQVSRETDVPVNVGEKPRTKPC